MHTYFMHMAENELRSRELRKGSHQKLQMSQHQHNDFLKEVTFFLVTKGPKKVSYPALHP